MQRFRGPQQQAAIREALGPGSGDRADETGVFVLKTQDKNPQTTTINGKYVLVWKKAEGR